MSTVILILCLLSGLLAVTMLFAKSPITAALSLLGILIMTAGIYGLIGEHMIATIQLVVYAGAIMVLFIFSIMLLNLADSEREFLRNPAVFITGILLGGGFFTFLIYSLRDYFSSGAPSKVLGSFDAVTISKLGGNSKVLSHALFSQFYISFEVISLALLIAIVAAVVLAKRKFD
jgi:NADH-quinone oxidoreductase subunit J